MRESLSRQLQSTWLLLLLNVACLHTTNFDWCFGCLSVAVGADAKPISEHKLRDNDADAGHCGSYEHVKRKVGANDQTAKQREHTLKLDVVVIIAQCFPYLQHISQSMINSIGQIGRITSESGGQSAG